MFNDNQYSGYRFENDNQFYILANDSPNLFLSFAKRKLHNNDKICHAFL